MRIASGRWFNKFCGALSLSFLSLQCVGCYAAVGPVFAYDLSKQGGLSVGWEAGGGAPVLHANIGQDVRVGGVSDTESAPSVEDSGVELVSYGVVEPWFYLGGTLGASYSTATGIGFVGGLWEGLPYLPRQAQGGSPQLWPGESSGDWLVSIALGWRYLGGVHQVYLAPKIGVTEHFELF